MPLRCSCGAILPEDARFCHKCGSPQYAEDIARLNAVEEPPPPPPADSLPPSSPQPVAASSSPIARAVRITLAIAAFAFLVLTVIPKIGPAVMAIFLASGFASVRIYLTRATAPLKMLGAAILGAMPWFWLSLLVAISMVALFSPEGHETLKAMNKPEVAKLLELLNNPAELISEMLQGFLICTTSGALGGILGVRWHPRNGPSH